MSHLSFDVDALACEIDEAKAITRIAHPIDQFNRSVTDDRTRLVFFMSLASGINQDMGDGKNPQMQDFHTPWNSGDPEHKAFTIRWRFFILLAPHLVYNPPT